MLVWHKYINNKATKHFIKGTDQLKTHLQADIVPTHPKDAAKRE